MRTANLQGHAARPLERPRGRCSSSFRPRGNARAASDRNYDDAPSNTEFATLASAMGKTEKGKFGRVALIPVGHSLLSSDREAGKAHSETPTLQEIRLL